MLSGPLYSQGLTVENPKPPAQQGIWASRGESMYDLDLFGLSVVIFTSLNRSYQDLQERR